MPDLDFIKDIILEDERVLLRPLTESDFEYLSDIAFSDMDLLQFSPNQIYTPELLQTYFLDAKAGRENCFRYPFIVFDKTKNEFAGSTSICNVSNYDKRFEIGYTWYGKKFQRSGLNRHCKWLLLNYAFETLEFERVEFKTDERNAASQLAIQQLGATKEGSLRSHTLMSDGFRRTTVLFSILKEEWNTNKAKFPLRKG